MHNTAADQKRLFNYIKNHTQDEWFVKSYGSFLFPIFTQGYLAVIVAGAFSKIAMPHGLAFQNWINDREFNWHWNTREMLKTRHQLFSALERDQNFGKKFYNEYLRGWRRFVTAAEKKQRLDLDKLTPEQPKNIFYDKEGRELQNFIDNLLAKNVSLRGRAAFPGIVRGKVKIIKVQNDFSKMKKGDILIAPNTRPEYVPIMKIAGAIISEEGGLTCHTAIVARELKIPAIVGMQGAIAALKDGDMVEVDANRGIVKILKHA